MGLESNNFLRILKESAYALPLIASIGCSSGGEIVKPQPEEPVGETPEVCQLATADSVQKCVGDSYKKLGEDYTLGERPSGSYETIEVQDSVSLCAQSTTCHTNDLCAELQAQVQQALSPEASDSVRIDCFEDRDQACAIGFNMGPILPRDFVQVCVPEFEPPKQAFVRQLCEAGIPSDEVPSNLFSSGLFSLTLSCEKP